MLQRVSIILCIGCLIGCSSDGEDRNDEITSLPYYPISKGMFWEYRGNNTLRTVHVLKIIRLKGAPCAVVQTKEKGKGTTVEYVHTNSAGVFVVATGKNYLSSPIPLLKLPLKTDNHWEFKIRPKNRKEVLQARYLVEPEETVKVPMGEYTAIPVRGEVYNKGQRVQTLYYWFAKDVGIIKQQLETQDSSVVYELVSFQDG